MEGWQPFTFPGKNLFPRHERHEQKQVSHFELFAQSPEEIDDHLSFTFQRPQNGAREEVLALPLADILEEFRRGAGPPDKSAFALCR